MVHYKLTYFNGRGLGELPRQIFALAGQEFEDVRMNWPDMSEWEKIKDDTPFKKLPVLEVDGKKLAQSFAISRYLARTFGLAGKDHWEEAQADAFTNQVIDFRLEIQPFFNAVNGFTKDDIETKRKEVLTPGVKKNFPFFESALKKNGSGFIVGNSVTWADLSLAGNTFEIFDKSPEQLEGFPELKAHMEKIRNIARVKAWIEKSPNTIW